ncbi:hypothetical protein G6F67_009597 [Rhizopus microsporus]|nr:hypothetical protein G6F67_009597 [Rhizopus microsporus]
MNLTNDHDMSIGTDFMTKLGIGLTGLPYKWDTDEVDNIQAAQSKYSDNSELLEEVDKEMSELEDCPQELLNNFNLL